MIHKNVVEYSVLFSGGMVYLDAIIVFVLLPMWVWAYRRV